MESITSCHGFGSFSDFINLNCCAAAALFPDEDLDRDGDGGDARSGDPCVATDPDGDARSGDGDRGDARSGDLDGRDGDGDKSNTLAGYRGGGPDGDCGDVFGAGDLVGGDGDGDLVGAGDAGDAGDKSNTLAGYGGGGPDGDCGDVFGDLFPDEDLDDLCVATESDDRDGDERGNARNGNGAAAAAAALATALALATTLALAFNGVCTRCNTFGDGDERGDARNGNGAVGAFLVSDCPLLASLFAVAAAAALDPNRELDLVMGGGVSGGPGDDPCVATDPDAGDAGDDDDKCNKLVDGIGGDGDERGGALFLNGAGDGDVRGDDRNGDGAALFAVILLLLFAVSAKAAAILAVLAFLILLFAASSDALLVDNGGGGDRDGDNDDNDIIGGGMNDDRADRGGDNFFSFIASLILGVSFLHLLNFSLVFSLRYLTPFVRAYNTGAPVLSISRFLASFSCFVKGASVFSSRPFTE